MEMTAFLKYHLQNICHFQNMPTSARSVGRGALPGLCTPHFYITAVQEGGKKKIHNIPHTSLGSLFSLSRIKCCWHLSPRFPEWAWRQNYADSQTHTRFLFPAQLSAANLQLFFIFPPRVHLPIKGDWEKHWRLMVLSCLVAWNLFHLEKARKGMCTLLMCREALHILIPRYNNPDFCSLGAQVNADTIYEWFPPHWQVLDLSSQVLLSSQQVLTPLSLSCASLLSVQDRIFSDFLSHFVALPCPGGDQNLPTFSFTQLLAE